MSFARPQSSGGVEYLPVGRHSGEESVGWIFFKDDPIRGFHLPGWRRLLIAPVSKQIPWYQGILQGISAKKSLRCSHLSSNSLRKLTGKILQVTGNSYRLTGNFTKNIARLA
ncbi:MAG TPA: hypothetical protein VFI51_14885 [Bradyrhizobium sp.]|nr:hypothetical protein [Bradyrhizobium sp.]